MTIVGALSGNGGNCFLAAISGRGGNASIKTAASAIQNAMTKKWPARDEVAQSVENAPRTGCLENRSSAVTPVEVGHPIVAAQRRLAHATEVDAAGALPRNAAHSNMEWRVSYPHLATSSRWCSDWESWSFAR